MTPLDLRSQAPRSPRAMTLGFYFLPRTIDKLRAELPGGNIGDYLNHDAGLSAFVIKRIGLDMGAFRDAVANAADESDVVRWLEARVDPLSAPALNAKLETLVIERMPIEDQTRVRARHPSINAHPNMSKILDILDADDRASFAGKPTKLQLNLVRHVKPCSRPQGGRLVTRTLGLPLHEPPE